VGGRGCLNEKEAVSTERGAGNCFKRDRAASSDGWAVGRKGCVRKKRIHRN